MDSHDTVLLDRRLLEVELAGIGFKTNQDAGMAILQHLSYSSTYASKSLQSMLKIVLWAVANNCYVCVGTRSEIHGTMLWTYGSEAAYADFKAGRIKLMASHEQADGAFLLALLASSRPDLSVLLREGRKH